MVIKELIFKAEETIEHECKGNCKNCKYALNIKGSFYNDVCEAVTFISLGIQQRE